MNRYFARIVFISVLIAVIALAMVWGPLSESEAQEIETVAPLYLVRIEGAISPGTAGFLKNSIEEAQEGGAQALIVELDTPEVWCSP